MSYGDQKDWELFNCSQQDEIDYVKKQYMVKSVSVLLS
jgi:hypothetical protein